MYYNYIRFGNITDFGSNYQLTVNDMKDLGIRLSAGIIGAIQYLFTAPQLSWSFPFINKANINLVYYSYLYKDSIIMVAGIIFLSPMVLFSLALPLLKKYMKLESKEDNEIYKHSVIITVIAIILTIIVSAMGGLSQRYACDFIYLFSIAGIIIFLLLYKNVKSDKLKSFITTVIFCLMLYTIFINLFSSVFISAGSAPLIKKNPIKYYYYKYMISFWE